MSLFAAHTHYLNVPKGRILTRKTRSEILDLADRHNVYPQRSDSVPDIKLLAKTNNSNLFVVSGDGLSPPILAKKMLGGSSEEYFRALEYVREKIVDPKCRTAKPIAFDVESNIVLMEFVDGKNVDEILGGVLTSERHKRDTVEKVGEWLGTVHSNTQKGSGAVDAPLRLREVEECLRDLGQQVEKEGEIGAALRYLRATASEVNSVPVTSCTIHGDCKPENFIQRGEAIVGIDLMRVDNGIPLVDVAQFTNQIMFLSLSRMGVSRLDTLDRLVVFFLDAYREVQPEMPRHLLRWLRVAHYLRYWAAEKSRANFIGRVQSALLKKLIARFLASS